MVGTRLRAFVGILGDNVRIHNDAPYVGISSLQYTDVGALPGEAITTTTGAVFHGGNNGSSPNNTITHGTGSGNSRSVKGLMLGGSSYPGGNANSAAALANPTISYSMTTLSSHYYGDIFEMILGPFPYARAGTTLLALSGGLGGGRGYHTAGTNASIDTAGPSGGGSGGVLGIAIKDLTCGTDCVFSANGASCADCSSTLIGATSATPAVIGGSSGGGGGVVVALFGQITGDYLPSIEAKGGNGGGGAFTLGTTTNTDGYFAEGGSGGDGGKVMVYIGFNLVGGSISVDVSGGTKGASQAGATPSWSADNVDGSAGLYHVYQAA
jgi:hypothetical protein